MKRSADRWHGLSQAISDDDYFQSTAKNQVEMCKAGLEH